MKKTLTGKGVLFGLSFFLILLLSAFSTVSAAEVMIDIQANGKDDMIEVTDKDTVTITAMIDPGSHEGIDGDWWVGAIASDGYMGDPAGVYYYDLSTSTLLYDQSAGLGELTVTYQGELYNHVFGSFTVLTVTDLTPDSTYTFYFAIDTDDNGVLDDDASYDYVLVNVINSDDII